MRIQRWGINSITGAAHESEQGRWVKYADHVAAVEAAEQAVGSIFAAGLIRLPSYQQGYAAALDAARDAVAALPWKVAVSFGPIDCDRSCEHGPCVCSGVMRPEAWLTGPADALAAIDGVCPCGGVGSGCRCEKEKP